MVINGGNEEIEKVMLNQREENPAKSAPLESQSVCV